MQQTFNNYNKNTIVFVESLMENNCYDFPVESKLGTAQQARVNVKVVQFHTILSKYVGFRGTRRENTIDYVDREENRTFMQKNMSTRKRELYF